MKALQPYMQHIRSFVRRSRRITPHQRQAIAQLWHAYGLQIRDNRLNFKDIFGRSAPVIIEIGFGMGDTLLALAKNNPHCDYIGVDVYEPGIGHVLANIAANQLTNIRIFNANIIDVLEYAIAPDCLTTALIYFPDPWPKRRHHKRRLIQSAFITSLTSKLKLSGQILLATDWADYACDMRKVLEQHPQLKNQAGLGHYLENRDHRPITKFEQQGLIKKYVIYDLGFTKQL